MPVRPEKAPWRLLSALMGETSLTKPTPLAQESTRCLLLDVKLLHMRPLSLTMDIMCQVCGIGIHVPVRHVGVSGSEGGRENALEWAGMQGNWNGWDAG